MSAPQLDLEWREEPQRLRGGVVDAVVAYCGCGWHFSASYDTRKHNRARAESMFDLHREKFCPFAALPPAEVDAARLLTPVGGGSTGRGEGP